MRRSVPPIRIYVTAAIAVGWVWGASGFGLPFAREHLAKHVHHEGKRDYRREVEQMEEQLRTAQLTGDVQTMDKLLSDDYVGISWTGQVNTKTQQIDRLRTRTTVLTSITLSDEKIKLVGAVAILTSSAKVEGTNEGATMKGLYRYTRIYQRSPLGVWKITNFEATRVPQAKGE